MEEAKLKKANFFTMSCDLAPRLLASSIASNGKLYRCSLSHYIRCTESFEIYHLKIYSNRLSNRGKKNILYISTPLFFHKIIINKFFIYILAVDDLSLLGSPFLVVKTNKTSKKKEKEEEKKMNLEGK
jgi:hypothetical protein